MKDKIIKIIKNPKSVLLYILDKTAIIFSDKLFLRIKYRLIMGKQLDLRTPNTFNEKLQWLKLHNKKPEYTKMVDKYAAKAYVAGIIGEEYIIPTLGIYDKFEDINFDELPNQFVLKCTHDSGGLVICKDKEKLDINTTRKILNKYLKRKYYFISREWPYKNIQPRIICERYISNKTETDLFDYKFMVFNGKVKAEFVCSNRFSSSGMNVDFFDTNWEKLPFERIYKNSKIDIPKPSMFSEMKQISEKLASNMNVSVVRIDLYEINGHIYFGEITLHPGGGWESFEPEEWDYKLGSWIELPKM